MQYMHMHIPTYILAQKVHAQMLFAYVYIHMCVPKYLHTAILGFLSAIIINSFYLPSLYFMQTHVFCNYMIHSYCCNTSVCCIHVQNTKDGSSEVFQAPNKICSHAFKVVM